jgi:excisionase family DNA binding protein
MPGSEQEGQGYLTRKEFARALGISLGTVDNWIARGIIVYWQARGGCKILIPVEELARHLKKGRKIPGD